MDHLTSTRPTEKWNASQKQIDVHCKEGKINSATLIKHNIHNFFE